MKKKNKGFTLTELIIVIAVIAILAAVLIPTLTGYVEKAKRSNDVQLAARMSDEVEYYCTENEIDPGTLLGTDVRTILKFGGFDLIPRTKKWTFVYDKNKTKVVVEDIENIDYSSKDNFSPSDPSNYKENMYLLGKGNSTAEKGINILCNLQSEEEFKVVSEMFKESRLKGLVKYFDIGNTIYFKNSTTFPVIDERMNTLMKKAVFTEGTVHIGKIKSTIFINDMPIAKVLKTIDADSELKSIFTDLKIVKNEDLINIPFKLEDNVKLVIPKEFENAKNSDFSIYITNISKVGDSSKEVNVTRVAEVNFYDENGIYARGELVFSLVEDVNFFN